MNYRIICNTPFVVDDETIYRNFVLFDLQQEGRELVKAVLTRQFNGNLQDATLTFTIWPGHVCYDKIMLSRSTITVEDDGVEIFRGRPVSCETGKTLLKTYTCEHMMKFMIDVPDIFSTPDQDNNVYIDTAITAMLTGYNQYVPENRRIYQAAALPVHKQAQKQKGASVYSNLSTWLKDAGYYAKITFNNDRYELAYQTYTGDVRGDFSVVFGENVMDYLETVNIDKLYTAVYPVGIDSGNESFTPITMDSATGVTPESGFSIDTTKKIITHDLTANQYGLVVYYVEIDLKDETNKTRQTVYTKAVQALKNANGSQTTFSISAVDPRLVGISNGAPMEGCYYPVIIPLPTNNQYQKLTKIVTDMIKPSGGSLTFGGSVNLLTDQAAAATVAAASAGVAAANARQAASNVNNKNVESFGTNGNWIVRKWANGEAECWTESGVAVAANGMTARGALYAIDGSEAFPTGLFTDTPLLYVSEGRDTGSSGNYAYWTAKHNKTTKTTAAYSVMRHANQATATTFYVNLYAIGRWK